MANEHNLIPNEKRTPSERRKNAQKAGIASGKARRERKLLREELVALLSDGDTQEKMCIALIRQAQRGNIRAFEVVRDTIGERPQDNDAADAEAISNVTDVLVSIREAAEKEKPANDKTD